MNAVSRPILFSAPMIRALLAGTKTQTRRALRAQPPMGTCQVSTWHHPDSRPMFFAWVGLPDGGAEISGNWPALPCPYGQSGDRLWVRETFAKIDGQTQPWIETDYRATYKHGDRLGDSLGCKKRWTPAIHMPRAASRITLQVNYVRVERLQDISEAGLEAEGIQELTDAGIDHDGTPRDTYRALWESINGKGSWAFNPWVWVVTFDRVAQP